ncbi:hypothetical protein [Microbacterium phyllosphaerae]|uniref:hypothetical protein n=1 Tax=Microbacterium phyllosphaerae TaxID=124798 RepID=UPI0011AE311C|nr:hypothetical protein [Microbacterium phyllosphaerae]
MAQLTVGAYPRLMPSLDPSEDTLARRMTLWNEALHTAAGGRELAWDRVASVDGEVQKLRQGLE